MHIVKPKSPMPNCPRCKKNDQVFASHMFGKKDLSCVRCKRTFQPPIHQMKKETEMKTIAKKTAPVAKSATKKSATKKSKAAKPKSSPKIRLQARIKKLEIRMARGKAILAKREARLKTLQTKLRKLAA